jgi:hypothetical protein
MRGVVRGGVSAQPDAAFAEFSGCLVPRGRKGIAVQVPFAAAEEI